MGSKSSEIISKADGQLPQVVSPAAILDGGGLLADGAHSFHGAGLLAVGAPGFKPAETSATAVAKTDTGAVSTDTSKTTTDDVLMQTVADLQRQQDIVKQNIKSELESQGWLGNTVDYIKSFVQPEETRGGLASKAETENARLTVLRQSAELGDVAQFQKTYFELTGARYEPQQSHALRSVTDLANYKASQHNWIDSTANGIAMVGGLMLAKKIPGATARSALELAGLSAVSTGAVKTTLKLTDYQYSDPVYDFGTGAALGALALGSELAGTAASVRLANVYGLSLKTASGSLSTAIATEGQSLGIKYLSSFARFGVPYSTYSAASPWIHETINSSYYHRPFDLGNTALNSSVGLASGLAGGTLLGFGMSKLPPALYGFFN